jgi:hypothetical protein
MKSALKCDNSTVPHNKNYHHYFSVLALFERIFEIKHQLGAVIAK